jgi:Fe-Mn family superoxide dismutase
MDETYNLNAKYLHELYFSNCFNATSDIHMNSHAYIRLSRDFGDFDRWQKDFMSCALSSGEGWAVTGYHLLLKKYVNTFISHHSGDVLLGLYPVVVVDMWSHAYHKDYIVDKKSYLVAMMREFNWTTIEQRFEVAEKIAGVLK